MEVQDLKRRFLNIFQDIFPEFKFIKSAPVNMLLKFYRLNTCTKLSSSKLCVYQLQVKGTSTGHLLDKVRSCPLAVIDKISGGSTTRPEIYP